MFTLSIDSVLEKEVVIKAVMVIICSQTELVILLLTPHSQTISVSILICDNCKI